jgi:hypothetical protein
MIRGMEDQYSTAFLKILLQDSQKNKGKKK